MQGNAIFNGSGASGDGIVNDGAIDVTGSGGSLSIDPLTFTNSGTIDVANGNVVTIYPTTFTATASRVIAIGTNSTLEIYPADAWTNLGSITLASGASLDLFGSVSAASLGSITNSGGAVKIFGTYEVARHEVGNLAVKASGLLEIERAAAGGEADILVAERCSGRHPCAEFQRRGTGDRVRSLARNRPLELERAGRDFD